MEMREIQSFVLLAEQLHFGRAAKLLHLSQPALTKQIHRMEEDLGSPLFLRGKGGTQLTSFGKQFLKEAGQVLHDFNALLERSRKAAAGEIGRIRMGFGFHTFELVPRLIIELRRKQPGIEISVRDLSTAEQAEQLLSDEIDLGFLRQPVPKEFDSLPVIKDRLALVTATSSTLPKNLKLSDCRNESFVTISEGRSPGFYNHMLRLCAQHGFHPRIVQKVTEFTTAIALVRAGLGVAIIPESFLNNRFAGIRIHAFPEKNAEWMVSAAWRKGDSNPALQKFLGLLRSEIKSNPKT